MSSSNTCIECGKSIPPDSPGGFCGECLLSLGLEASAEWKVKSVEGAEHGPTPVKQILAGTEPASQTESKAHVCAVTALTEKPGDRIGRYRLLQEIGQG